MSKLEKILIIIIIVVGSLNFGFRCFEYYLYTKSEKEMIMTVYKKGWYDGSNTTCTAFEYKVKNIKYDLKQSFVLDSENFEKIVTKYKK